jgi:hypothetical protein
MGEGAAEIRKIEVFQRVPVSLTSYLYHDAESPKQ